MTQKMMSILKTEQDNDFYHKKKNKKERRGEYWNKMKVNVGRKSNRLL